jgi:glycerol-3-phosphate acyltransferase PlsY
MTDWIWVILVLAGYLLGSFPASYLAARMKGVDLREYGTRQVGGGNLWRMTSWKLGLPVGVFDVLKGAVMVWVAYLQGLTVAQQMFVGLAVIAGHNWPVFLRFYGGRGIGTTIGIITMLPLINDMSPWPSVTFWAILLLGRLLLGSTPLPVLAGIIIMPIVSWRFGEPMAVTLAFVALALIIIVKRLTAQPITETGICIWKVLLNRFLFDRDISDRKGWMYRKPTEITKQEPWED